MDPDISSWMLQYLAHERHIDFSIIGALSSTLPLPRDDILVKKMFILRLIFKQLEDASITEAILDNLEMIEEFDRLMGMSSIPASMKRAYIAVAVECTVRHLYGKIDNRSKYFYALERIWRIRIRIMEEAEPDIKSNLLTDDLLYWGARLEVALQDEDEREEILAMNTRSNAFLSLEAYLEETWQGLVPFLEACSKDYPTDEGTEEGCGRKNISSDMGPSSDDHEQNTPLDDIKGGDEISDPKKLGKGTSVSTPTFARAVEELQSRFMELKGVVKDPLPNALKVAESLMSDKGYTNTNVEEDSYTTIKVNSPIVAGESECPPSGSHKPSLMERNATARTYEWDESLEETEEEEGTADPSGRRPHLPSVVRQVVSPLKKYEPIKFSVRRQIKKWSALEEEALIKGIEKFGEGKWKLILDSNHDIFEERNPVDLKDKWRNLNH